MPSKKTPVASKAPAAKTKPAKQPAAAADDAGHGKPKLVRDGFTIPKDEYTVIGDLKHRAARLGRPVKKSEVLRAGIAALKAMDDRKFVAALSAVPSLKTGRPARNAG